MIQVRVEHIPDDLNADDKITSQTFVQSDNQPDWMVVSYFEDVLKNVRRKAEENSK